MIDIKQWEVWTKTLSKDDYADKWRKHYDEITCTDQFKLYTMFQERWIKEQDRATGNFRVETPIDFFEYILSKKKNVNVIEFGGGQGGLAKLVIDKYGDKINKWVNYEAEFHAVTDSICDYPQYTAIVTNKFFWELDIDGDWDVFVSSNAIEHVRANELKKIFLKIKNKVDFIYLESPICDDSVMAPVNNVNRFFIKCGALHILEIGWEQIMNMLPEFMNLEQYAVPYIMESNPLYMPSTPYVRPLEEQKEEYSYKTIFYKGLPIRIRIPKYIGMRMPGRAIIRYNSPKSTDATRCLEKKEYDKEKLVAEKKQFDIIMEKIEKKEKPDNPFLFDMRGEQ